MRHLEGPRDFRIGGLKDSTGRPDGVPEFTAPSSNCLVDPILMDDTECLKVEVRTDWSRLNAVFRDRLDDTQIQEKADLLKTWLLRELLAITIEGEVPKFRPRKVALLLYWAQDEKARQLIDLVVSTDTPKGHHYSAALPADLMIEPYPLDTSVEAMALSRHHVMLDVSGTFTNESGNQAPFYHLGITSSPSSAPRRSSELTSAAR